MGWDAWPFSEWAPGTKPQPTKSTYRLLGRAAAAIHAGADGFVTSFRKAPRTVDTEVHQQLSALRPVLEQIRRWDEAVALGEVACSVPAGLERGICHNDLTLDNVHIDGDRITVFDFDSTGDHWRASEAQGIFHAAVLKAKPWRWDAWRAGHTEIRPMLDDAQRAVPFFVLMFQFENTAWKLGLTHTSVGQLLGVDELGGVVNSWRRWADTQC